VAEKDQHAEKNRVGHSEKGQSVLKREEIAKKKRKEEKRYIAAGQEGGRNLSQLCLLDASEASHSSRSG